MKYIISRNYTSSLVSLSIVTSIRYSIRRGYLDLRASQRNLYSKPDNYVVSRQQ